MQAASTLRRARRRAGLSLRGLAARAGTSHSTLAAYESGRKTPTVETLDRIVRAAGFDVGLELVPRVGGADPAAQGRELVAALELAAQFPSRHDRTLTFPQVSDRVSTIADQVVAIHAALDGAGIPHAFGGALALAWCTERARGTIDIDLNIFVGESEAADALAALPAGVAWSEADRAAIERDGQARLWWDGTPIDVFLSTTDFHAEVARRSRREQFAGTEIPFLGCSDLAVFKAFFDRTRDWADLEEMAAAGTLDVDRVVGVLTRYLGPGDPRIERLTRLA